MECLLRASGRARTRDSACPSRATTRSRKVTGAQAPGAKAQRSREPGQSWRSIAWLHFPGTGSRGGTALSAGAEQICSSFNGVSAGMGAQWAREEQVTYEADGDGDVRCHPLGH